jgi:uncharacterized membrane protein YbjE (DUF340 family)
MSILNYYLLPKAFKLNEVLALSQGYGWYSMSGILFTELHSAKYGGIALPLIYFVKFLQFY